MKRIMTKLLSTVLVLAICAALLTSCLVPTTGVGSPSEGGNSSEGSGGGAGESEGGGTTNGDEGTTDGDEGTTDGDEGATDEGTGAIPDEEETVTSDPYESVDKNAFYETYTPATSYMDSYYRTQHGLMSGSLEVPDAAPTVAEYQPMRDGKLVKNSGFYYSTDGNTYYVLDGYGNPVLKIYRGGAYITLEEVAAHMYAFGELPANYTSKKSQKPASNPWGIYLRCNHSYFSGDIARYPYEPKLPDINGCGGDLQYYEMDIGTTGTYTGHSSDGRVYNNGTSITRGAARIVYARRDLNKNGVFDVGEVYLFYTYNHYNDFQEYLNYYGGWGEIFGNITGGGTLSSETNYNPTPYVKVLAEDFRAVRTVATEVVFIVILDDRRQLICA